MRWSRLEPDARALAALGVAVPLFAVVFLVAPADNLLRIVFLSFLAGVVTAAVCWQHFPGWDLFVAGCAFLVAGWFHGLPAGSGWQAQAALLMPAVAAWYAGARLSELLLVFPVGYDYRTRLTNWQRLRDEVARGSLILAIHALAVAAILGLLLPAAPIVAFPVGLGLSLAVGLRVPVRRVLWPVLGTLAGLWLAGFVGAALDRWAGVAPTAPSDPWLVGGLLTVGVMLGLWGSRWYRGEPKGPVYNGRPPRGRSSLEGSSVHDDLRPSGGAPPAPPPPRPEAPPPRAAGPKG